MANNIISDFFGVGYGDAEYIQDLIDISVEAGVDMDDAFNIFAEYCGGDFINDNVAAFTNLIIESIFQAVYNRAVQDLNDYCEENNIEPFDDIEADPYMNCLDSRMYVIFDSDYGNPDGDFINSYLDNGGDIQSVIEEDENLAERLAEKKKI